MMSSPGQLELVGGGGGGGGGGVGASLRNQVTCSFMKCMCTMHGQDQYAAGSYLTLTEHTLIKTMLDMKGS